MRKFQKSSTAMITTLALGLLLALPAAAQTLQTATDSQTYTIRSAQTNNGAEDSMTFTVVQKPGVKNGEVQITWKEDSKAKAELEKGNVYHSTVEYDVETAKSKVVTVQE